MSKTTMWVVIGTGALALAAALYAIPAVAAGRVPMMVGSGSSMMAGTDMNAMHSSMASSGDMSAMHDAMAPLMSQMPAMHTQAMSEVATLLGVSTEELNKAKSDGKSLADLAVEKKVAIGEVRAVMTRSMKAFLDKAVEQNSITAEQAGKMLGYMEKNMDQCLSGQMGNMMDGPMMGSEPGA